MSLNDTGRIKPALVLGAIIFVLAFALLFWLGDYGFIAAFFLALLLALLTTIVIYLAFGMGEAEPYGSASQSSAKPASARAASTGASGAAAAAGASAASGDDAGRDAAAEADAAERAAEEEAARKAVEAAQQEEAAKAEADRKAAEAEAEAARAAEEEAARAEEAATASVAATASAAASGEDYDGDGVVEGVNEGTRPSGLDAPRDGSADDLKMIKGIGPKLEKLCNSLGFWHFDQVAGWSSDEVAWVDANLQGFKGRVSRDKWVEQARTLASGGETEFSKRVEGGDVY